ncbi:MAG TPA: serine hydrolase domain-containing protein [Candidatus Acidoferrum sp.]|nr:serine hydrolase domain-containing protein [Candidatus Acidoferrum sp.]
MLLRTPPFADVDAAIDAALGTRFSAAVVRIEQRGRVVHQRAFGRTRDDAPALPCFVDTRFDLASLTKVFVASVALDAVGRGLLALDAPLVTLVPEWRGQEHEPITLRQLLAHDAGFKSGADYRTLLAKDVEVFALTEPLAVPPGEKVIYSDLGFIALGTILARAQRRALAVELTERLRAWGAASTAYAPRGVERAAIPATETDVWRGTVQGAVHDEKAHLLAGYAGHAGLFGTARDVAALGEWYLGALHGRPTPLDAGLAREAVREQAFDPVLRRGLGWALKTTDENSCGAQMSAATFGHTGFTGTSIWVDPERDLNVVLLTNAVHHGRTDIRAIRAAVCDAAIAALDRI